tara:strand:+ start:11 stop:499 length:489 start_codon:yes stop_codon:yes gene_type:complete
MVDYQNLSIVLTGVGLIIALVYYIMTLRYTSKARQRKLIMQRSHTYNVEYQKAWHEVIGMSDWEDAEDWAKTYGRDANLEAYSKWMHIMRDFGLAGIHLQEGADPDLLFKLYPLSAVIPLWEQFEPIIMVMRERLNDPRMWEPFEYLYNEAKKRAPELTVVD